jgi:hypothetical protein
MNRDIFLSAASITTFCIVLSNGESVVYDSYSKAYNPEFIQISQDPNFYIPTISELLIKEVDSEMDDALEIDSNRQIKESFIVSAEQLKKLLLNESIKKTPDVLMFNKGYVGLVWETKNDESVFVYSIPDGTLFFNRVGANFSETRNIDANKKHFSALIEKINAMV